MCYSFFCIFSLIHHFIRAKNCGFLMIFLYFSSYSVYLEDFLQEGRDHDGNVPELIFEQLSFDYPVCVNFTSGTTGLPKAAVHSIGVCMKKFQCLKVAIH